MKFGLFLFSLLIFLTFKPGASCFAQSQENFIEIDSNNHSVEIVNFHLGSYSVNGKGILYFSAQDGSLTVQLEAEDISINNEVFGWLKLKLEKRGNIVFIQQLVSSQGNVKGQVDLVKNIVALNLEGHWYEKSPLLEGQMYMKVKTWGKIGEFLTSGYLTVNDGIYKGNAFSSLRLDFIGRPPLLNITDSELILKDGTSLEISGVLDLRDFSNVMPGATFTAQKVFIGDWQVFSENKNSVGLKKNVDDKIDIFLNAEGQEGDENSGPKTEVRYNLKDDNFLKFKMEDDQTTLKIEQRKDF
ncbi:MAG: hypothetical protein PHU64_05710 [Candidatus Omnitrophica bacterium]|nr:hypothetical protein [Candidatus Omnitrophota bacterium]MDD5430222.1 hypothetical protein [Candidatus Omnitrophota bacterium]